MTVKARKQLSCLQATERGAKGFALATAAKAAATIVNDFMMSKT